MTYTKKVAELLKLIDKLSVAEQKLLLWWLEMKFASIKVTPEMQQAEYERLLAEEALNEKSK